MQKARGEIPGPRFCSTAGGLVVNPAHASHTTARHSWSSAVLLWPFGHHGFRGDQKPGDRRSVLQGRPHNFGRVNDSLADEVHVFTVLGVEAEAILILFKDLADDDGTVLARVNHYLASRPRERLAHDVNAGLLVIVLRAHALQRFRGTEQGDAAARQDTFFD